MASFDSEDDSYEDVTYHATTQDLSKPLTPPISMRPHPPLQQTSSNTFPQSNPRRQGGSQKPPPPPKKPLSIRQKGAPLSTAAKASHNKVLPRVPPPPAHKPLAPPVTKATAGTAVSKNATSSSPVSKGPPVPKRLASVSSSSSLGGYALLTKEEDDYDYVVVAGGESLPVGVRRAGVDLAALKASLDVLTANVELLMEKQKVIDGYMMKQEDHMSSLEERVSNCQTTVFCLEDKICNGSQPKHPIPETGQSHTLHSGGAVASENNSEENIGYLKQLTEYQILSMLDCLNLSRYKVNFKKEELDGDLLSQCDEHMLETELGIASKVHRLKLMRIIKGDYPVPSA